MTGESEAAGRSRSPQNGGIAGSRPASTRVLVLGGTADGRALANLLSADDRFTVVSSLAGRTATPLLPKGEVRIGGFGGVDGLVAYLRSNGRDNRIDAVVDATHPFAAQMTAHAAEACRLVGLPLVILHRPGWEPADGDRWVEVPSVAAAAEVVEAIGQRVFLTIGRQELAPFAPLTRAWFLIRSIDPPTVLLPPAHQLLLDRGPFDVEREIELMKSHEIDVVVSKNSGGPATYGKIAAARALGLPVVMVQRPLLPVVPTVADSEAAVGWLQLVRAQTSGAPR